MMLLKNVGNFCLFCKIYAYEGCPKCLAQLLIKTKKFIFNEKLHYKDAFTLANKTLMNKCNK